MTEYHQFKQSKSCIKVSRLGVVRMRTAVLILFLSTISSFCVSQSYFEFEISGKATNRWNGVPIPYALIELKLKDSKLAATSTNNVGEYSFQPNLLDTNNFYNISVTHERFIGYGAGSLSERHKPGVVIKDISVDPSLQHYDSTLAMEDLTLGRQIHLIYGEFGFYLNDKCLASTWNKYGSEVVLGSTYLLPKASEYNEVMNRHIDSLYGESWRAERDSILNECETNNICGINLYHWAQFGNRYSYYPSITFGHNSTTPDDTSLCILKTFYSDFVYSEINKVNGRVEVFCSQDALEEDSILYQKRCLRTKEILLDLGYSNDQIVIAPTRQESFWCHELSIDECSYEERRRNRTATFWIMIGDSYLEDK